MALRPIPIIARTKNTLAVTPPVTAPTPIVANKPTNIPPRIKSQNLWMGSIEGGPVNSTVATSGNPVVKVTPPKTTVDYSTLDKWWLQDEIARMTFRMKNGSITENDAVNYNRLTRLLAEQNSTSASAVDTSEIDRLRAEQEAIRGQRMTADEQALAAFKQAQQAQTAQRIAAVQEAGSKQREAAQTATSFSWFGRSTVNAEQQANIEKQTQQAILYENAASDLAIQKYQAELQGASSEVLSGYDQQIAAAQWQASKIRQDAVAEANKVNTEQSALFGKTLQEVIANSGLKLDVNDEAALQQVINISRNPDGSVNEAVVAGLPKEYQAIVRAGVTSGVGKWMREAPKVERIGGTTKAPIYGYWDGSKFVTTNAQWVPTVRSGGGGSGGWGWGWGWGWVSGWGSIWTQWWSTWSVYDDLLSVDPWKFKNVDQSKNYWFATNAILANEEIKNTQDYINWLNKYEWAWYNQLPNILKPDNIKKMEQSQENYVNAVLRQESWAAIPDNEMKKYIKQYFPQPWDSKELIKQKEQNRIIKANSLVESSGKSDILRPILNKTTIQKSNVPAPTTQQTTTPAKTTSTGWAGRWVKK